jgi:hypothetical protein
MIQRCHLCNLLKFGLPDLLLDPAVRCPDSCCLLPRPLPEASHNLSLLPRSFWAAWSPFWALPDYPSLLPNSYARCPKILGSLPVARLLPGPTQRISGLPKCPLSFLSALLRVLGLSWQPCGPLDCCLAGLLPWLPSWDNGPSEEYNAATDSLAHLDAISLAALHTFSTLPTQTQVHEQDSLLLLCTHCVPLTLLRSAFIIP